VRTVWVNSAVIGSKTLGVITKDYSVLRNKTIRKVL